MAGVETSNVIDSLTVASASPRMAKNPWKGVVGVVRWREPYLWNGCS